MTSTPPTRGRDDRSPHRSPPRSPHRSPHRRYRPHHLLGATLAAGSATVLLAGCGADGTDAAGSARSAAAAVSHAVSSAAAAASDAATGIPTPDVTDDATTAGSGGSGGAGGAGTGPCALLTVQQASQLNHVTYSSANSADVGDIGTCDYNPGPGNPEDLTVTVTDDPFCWGALTSSNGPGTTVPGVGDAAFGFSTGMDVKHGGTCVDIAGNTAAESSGDFGPDTAMAQIILKKLG